MDSIVWDIRERYTRAKIFNEETEQIRKLTKQELHTVVIPTSKHFIQLYLPIDSVLHITRDDPEGITLGKLLASITDFYQDGKKYKYLLHTQYHAIYEIDPNLYELVLSR